MAKIEKLLEQRAALDAKIRAATAKEQAAKRKQETREKILLGAWVTRAVKTNNVLREILLRDLPGFLTNGHDQAAMADWLKSISSPQPAAAESASGPVKMRDENSAL